MKLDIQLKDLQVYAENRDRNESEMMDLKQTIEHERADKIRELADKEREKVQATDKLREEMQKKIREQYGSLVNKIKNGGDPIDERSDQDDMDEANDRIVTQNTVSGQSKTSKIIDMNTLQ